MRIVVTALMTLMWVVLALALMDGAVEVDQLRCRTEGGFVVRGWPPPFFWHCQRVQLFFPRPTIMTPPKQWRGA